MTAVEPASATRAASAASRSPGPSPSDAGAAMSALARAGLIVIVLGIGGCGFLPTDPQRMPEEVVDPERDLQPIGPVVELGRGRFGGLAWRYVVYQSRIGTCTQLDWEEGAGGRSCGGEFGQTGDGSAMALMSVARGTDTPTTVEGITTEDVAAVWMEHADGGRTPATLMPLEPLGLPGRVFLAIVAEGIDVTRAVALDEHGVEIDGEEIFGP